MTQFGISSEALKAICEVFASSKKIQRVRIFGSRAMGRHREGSDVDLAVEGYDLNLNDLLDIRLKLENLMLPYRFDVVDAATLVENDRMRDHVSRVGIVIYERVALPDIKRHIGNV